MVQLKAKALFEYSCTLQQQQQEDHLPLRAGDVLIINQQEHDSGWWNGTRLSDGSTGWFPGSYVEVLSESATEQPKSATSGKSWQKPQQKSSNSLNVAQLGEMLQRGINVNSNPVSPTLQQHQQQQSANGEWEQYYTEDGEPYYVNSVTNESRWELPSASGSRKASLVKSPRTSFSQHHQPELPMLPPPPLPADSPSFDSNRPLSRPGSVSSWSIGTRPTVADGEQSPVQGAITDSTGRFGYEGNFWSDKGDKSGFDILVLKHRNGKEVCKDIAQFMAERARIEEIYAKSLMDLANGQLGDLESGTMKTAWNQLKFDVLSQGKQRLEFSKQLIKEVQTPIMNFKNEQKKTRKNYEATIAEDRRLMLVKYSNARKASAIF